MSIHEECGVFGVFSPKANKIAETVYYGLYALQHRGQESCGMVVNDDGVFSSHIDTGLVGEVFTKEVLSKLPNGRLAVGHVRYGTIGGNTRINCQPIVVNHYKGKLALAHNGNLSNAQALRDGLELTGTIFHTTSDTETIAYIITKERLTAPSIEEAISRAVEKLEGAYSLVIMSAAKLIAVRDPHGFRPLCFGVMPDGTYIAASESCALNAVGASFVRNLEPGEILVFSDTGIRSSREHCNKAEKRLCVFEYIYFARPDSEIDEINVHDARVKAGALLAESCPADADIVIGVPDSGIDAALGYSSASRIPYGIGLIKNKYIGRTFISPTQKDRSDQIKIKLSPIKSVVSGKRIVLIDDSIVRGNTSKRIITLLREAGASKIHMRISSPPFLHPCYYGTDIDSEDKLIAKRCSAEQIAVNIGADSLGYLPADALVKIVGGDVCCTACFDGKYPTAINPNVRKDRFDRKLSETKGD